jgi:ADP-heptose:LPS heptosyltransferase
MMATPQNALNPRSCAPLQTTRRSVRPLVIRFGALGDMVLLTVMIRTLAARFGSPVDIVASGAWSHALLAGQPGVGSIYAIRSRRTPYVVSREQQRLVEILRGRGPGPTWYAEATAVGRSLLNRSGIGDEWVVDAQLHPLRAHEHFADYWHRLANLNPARMPQPAAAAHDCDQPALVVSDRAQQELSDWLRCRALPTGGLILVQAGNKRTMRVGWRRRASNSKYWPEERWATVLRQVRARHADAPILLLGVAAEWALNRDIMARARTSNVFNLAGELPMQRLLALQTRAQGMISVDSGPAHTATAVGCHVVALFGQARPEHYGPRGSGAKVRCLCGQQDGARSMLGIQPGDVVIAWDELQREARCCLTAPGAAPDGIQ